MLDFIEGKKTYIVCLLIILYAVLGWWLGQMDLNAAGVLILEALGGASLRHGISKLE